MRVVCGYWLAGEDHRAVAEVIAALVRRAGGVVDVPAGELDRLDAGEAVVFRPGPQAGVLRVEIQGGGRARGSGGGLPDPRVPAGRERVNPPNTLPRPRGD